MFSASVLAEVSFSLTHRRRLFKLFKRVFPHFLFLLNEGVCVRVEVSPRAETRLDVSVCAPPGVFALDT